jgi:hypothetical protein
MRIRLPLALLVALSLGACGKDEPASSPPSPGDGHEKEAEHAHEKGPHGGALIVVGEEAAHLEVLHDEEAGRVTVHVLGGDMKPLAIPTPLVLNFSHDGKPVQLQGTPEGAAGGNASVWVFVDEALKGEPEGARFRAVIGGKTYSPSMEHAH